MPNKVFISYRREDSQYQARHIYDAFVHALPPDTVFMDVDSIPPGADFVEILEGWVRQCDVLLALIGPRWVNSIDPRTSLRRLDNPEDFVRIEIRGALERTIPVVPVLLDSAGMPTAAELPDDIKALRRRNAEFVDFRTFDSDVQRLIKRLKLGNKIEPPGEAPGSQAAGVGNRPARVVAANTFLERINAVASKPLTWVASLLAVGSISFVMNTWTHVDESSGVANFARSEENRRTAEARAGEATDALAKTEKARQEAEAKATAAAAALIKTEENRRAAEARANDAADALKKSDKTRLDAEARATTAAAAQAKAEEGQRAADKARVAAEATASTAATARFQADIGRQDAETRLKQAIDALAKSEQARKDAETNAEPQAKGQEPNKTLSALDRNLPSISPKPRRFLADIGSSSRWAINATANCGNRDGNNYSMASAGDTLTWTIGSGDIDIEAIVSSAAEEFHTRTRTSRHIRSETDYKIGTTWTYLRDGEQMRVRSSLGHNYVLVRCP